jgi:hypothetical protein
MSERINKEESVPAFYKGVHRHSFRSGERGEIIGVRMFITKYGMRPCFMVLYYDGVVDYSPIEDIGNYVIEGPNPR